MLELKIWNIRKAMPGLAIFLILTPSFNSKCASSPKAARACHLNKILGHDFFI